MPMSVAARIAQEPLVAQTLTLSSFVPDQQKEKLALIADANNLLDSTLNPLDVAAPPSDARTIAALRGRPPQKLRAAAGNAQDKPAQRRAPPGRCAGCAGEGRPAGRHRAGARSLRAGLQDHAGPGVGFPEGRARHHRQHAGRHEAPTGWRADGTARIQVFPKNTSNDPAALSAFSDQVLSVAPQATGAPISIRESGKTIVGAFAEAGVLSFLVISILLALVLRSVHDVLMTLAPLVLSGPSDPGDLRACWGSNSISPM